MENERKAAVPGTVGAVVRRRCSNCAHAILPRRRERKGMPVLICGQSAKAGWDAVREWDNCCDKWKRKAPNVCREGSKEADRGIDA